MHKRKDTESQSRTQVHSGMNNTYLKVNKLPTVTDTMYMFRIAAAEFWSGTISCVAHGSFVVEGRTLNREELVCPLSHHAHVLAISLSTCCLSSITE